VLRSAHAGRGDEQVEILKANWNEMKALNARVDQTNARVDQTNARLDQINARLDALRAELREEIDGLRGRAAAAGRRTISW